MNIFLIWNFVCVDFLSRVLQYDLVLHFFLNIRNTLYFQERYLLFALFMYRYIYSRETLANLIFIFIQFNCYMYMCLDSHLQRFVLCNNEKNDRFKKKAKREREGGGGEGGR